MSLLPKKYEDSCPTRSFPKLSEELEEAESLLAVGALAIGLYLLFAISSVSAQLLAVLVFSVIVSVVRLSDSLTVPLTGVLFAIECVNGLSAEENKQLEAFGFDIRAALSSAASGGVIEVLLLCWCSRIQCLSKQCSFFSGY